MNLKIVEELNRILKINPSLVTYPDAFLQVVNGTFHIELDNLTDHTDLYAIAEQVDNEVLHQYFSKVWHPETKKYKYSGLSLIDEINEQNPERVIDVGCGYNEFKGKINNLVGLDPYNDRADIKGTILGYKADTSYDVAICLGSINFGSADKIIKELQHVCNLVKPGGRMYFRVNPGLAHEAPESRWITFFDWDSLFISNAANMLNCDLLTIRQDYKNRIYFVLRKK